MINTILIGAILLSNLVILAVLFSAFQVPKTDLSKEDAAVREGLEEVNAARKNLPSDKTQQ